MSTLDERLALALRPGLVAGRWDDALASVRLTLVDHAGSPKALLALAVCYFHKREFGEAIAWLDQAARRAGQRGGLWSTRPAEPPAGGEATPGDPTLPVIFLFRGLAYAARKLPAAARAEFAELRAFEPTPVRWERFAGVLQPDELTRARLAAEAAGLPTE